MRSHLILMGKTFPSSFSFPNGLNFLNDLNGLNFSDGCQLEVTAVQIGQQRTHMLGEISAAIAVEANREIGPAGE